MEEHEVFFNIKMIVNTSVLFFPNSCLLYSSIGVGKELVLWATFFFSISTSLGRKDSGKKKTRTWGIFIIIPAVNGKGASCTHEETRKSRVWLLKGNLLFSKRRWHKIAIINMLKYC